MTDLRYKIAIKQIVLALGENAADLPVDDWLPYAEAAIRAIQDAGYAIVPKDPQPEMIGAWYRHKNGFHYHGRPEPTDTSDYGAYRAMIKAAPDPMGEK